MRPMRTSAACMLLAALAFPMAANGGSDASTMAAHDDANSDSKGVNHAKAEAAASAAVSNSNSKSGLKMEKTGTKAAKKEHKAKGETRAAVPGGAPNDQSVCDLSPHPSWCDQ